MANFVNEFSWSFSRHRRMEKCLREYYYHSYFSWNGWNHSAPLDVKQAYLLKKLTNQYGWKGNLCHKMIEESLYEYSETGSIDVQRKIKEYTEKMRTEFKQSSDLLIIGSPSQVVGLVEHYYHKQLPKNFLQSAIDDVVRWYTSFFDIDLCKKLLKNNENWIYIEKLDCIFIDAVKVWVKVDLLYKSKKGYVYIVDWKTGRVNQSDTLQLGVYGLYVNELDDTRDNKDVKGIDVYLNDKKYLKETITEKSSKKSKVFIENSIDKMKNLLVNADTESNQPKHIKHFPKINSNCVGLCVYCNYRKLCHNTEV